MNRKHAALIALILSLAAVAGGIAAIRTAHVGAAAKAPSLDAQIAARTARLNRAEAALKRAIDQAQAPAQPVSTAAAPQAQRIVYVRPAPRVVTIHRSGGEREGNDGHGSEGGGFDD
jgi:hypothetical protein